jgi:hypothetical protein
LLTEAELRPTMQMLSRNMDDVSAEQIDGMTKDEMLALLKASPMWCA